LGLDNAIDMTQE